MSSQPAIPEGYRRLTFGEKRVRGDLAWTWTSPECLSLGWVVIEEGGVIDDGHVPTIRPIKPPPPTIDVTMEITKAVIEDHVKGEIETYESLPGLWTVAMNRMAITHEDSEDDAKHTAEKLGIALHNSILKFVESRGAATATRIKQLRAEVDRLHKENAGEWHKGYQACLKETR